MGRAHHHWWRMRLEPLAAPRPLEAEQFRVAPAVRDFPRRRAARGPRLPREAEAVFQAAEVAPWVEGVPTEAAVQHIPAPAAHTIPADPGVSPVGPPPVAAAFPRPVHILVRRS